jgi:pimeloyl-ACP methyl ester carboxylesterase
VSERAPDGTAFDLTGPADAPLVVLIHGLGLARALWDAHRFAGYRTLAYDLYGHGDSVPPPEPATLALYARQIAGLMDHVGVGAAHLVGFSIGGMINRRFALDMPDRVLSLAILNSPHDRGAAGQAAVEERALKAREQGAFATFDAALERWFTPDYRATGPGPALVQDWRGSADAEGYAQAAWVLAHGVRELIAPVPPIRTPTLVITCENDPGSTPAMSQAIAAEIAGAELHILPQLRHLGLMEDPGAFSALIGPFLDRQHA